MSPFKYLLLVDMNGTLCYRSTMPVPGVRPVGHIRKRYYYGRPGIDSFIDTLVASKRFIVCVYSSMQMHNITDALKIILQPAQVDKIHRIFDRDVNKRDPDGVNEWDTIRDVNKVWEAMPGYGPQRTILLDNETRKFIDCSRNGLLVPKFEAEEVADGVGETLEKTRDYLLQLAHDATEDVRSYMERNPFANFVANDNCSGGSSVPNIVESPVAAEGTGADEEEIVVDQVWAALSLGSTDCAGDVPPDTQLYLTCIEGWEFVMMNNSKDLIIKGLVRKGVCIGRKMLFGRLVASMGRENIEVIREPESCLQTAKKTEGK